jgi:hypothetical protein
LAMLGTVGTPVAAGDIEPGVLNLHPINQKY